MAKRKITKAVPEVPAPDLPPEELQQAWDKYLDYHVGAGYSPKWEVIVSPERLEKFLEFVVSDQLTCGKVTRSLTVELFLEALEIALEKLPLMQRAATKSYYLGRPMRSSSDSNTVVWVEPQTQAEIGEELGYSQKTISKMLSRARKNLKVLIRKEMFRLVKEEVQNMSTSDMEEEDERG